MHIIVKNNRFKCRIHDMDSFLDMTLENTRKLWKLMFTEAWNNEASMQAAKQWLENTEVEWGSSLTYLECAFMEALQEAEEKRQVKESFGSVRHTAAREARRIARAARQNAEQAGSLYKQAKRHCIKVEKLKAIFYELHNRYWW